MKDYDNHFYGVIVLRKMAKDKFIGFIQIQKKKKI